MCIFIYIYIYTYMSYAYIHHTGMWRGGGKVNDLQGAEYVGCKWAANVRKLCRRSQPTYNPLY